MFPAGWNETRVRLVLDHDNQTDEEAVAEDESAYEDRTHAIFNIPLDLLPAVRELISRRKTAG